MLASSFDNPRFSYAVVFLCAAALYILTCAPGPLWQDSGMIQYRVWHNDIEGGLGLALSHPLFYIIAIGAKYIPFGEFAYRVNLVAAIAGAVTIANLFLLLRLWLNKNLPALIGAASLAFSHTFWQHACVVETYTLYTALLTAELMMLLQYIRTQRISYLYLLGLFNGLSISDHMFGSLPFLCYAVFLVVLLAKRTIRFKHLFTIVILWLIGFSPYAYLIIKEMINTGDVVATISSALFGKGWQKSVLNVGISVILLKENLILMAYNFPTPTALLFIAGLWKLRKVSPSRGFANIVIALLVMFLLFAFRYTVPDRYAFFIPFYCMVAILIGVGCEVFISRHNRDALGKVALILTLLPILIYMIAPRIAEKVRFTIPSNREIAYRNNYTWFLQPWKQGYNGPEKFAQEALAAAEKPAIIIADGTTVYPLWYAQTFKDQGHDIKVVSTHGSYQSPIPFPTEQNIEQLLSSYLIYVVSPVRRYCPPFILERYYFVRSDGIWKISERR
jgi:hypothetical protein